MKLIPLLLALALLTSCGKTAHSSIPPMPVAVSTKSPTPTEPSFSASFAVIGYFPDYRELNPTWAQSLTDIIYFSAEPRADGTLNTSRLSDKTWQDLNELKLQNGIRLHLSVGGWERSSAFASMTSDPITRQKFISALIAFAIVHNLDGVDFD